MAAEKDDSRIVPVHFTGDGYFPMQHILLIDYQ